MYFGGSIVGKASTIGIGISPIPPLIFTGRGSKVRNLASFKISLNFEPPAFENAASYPILKQKCNAAMIALCLATFGNLSSRTPENALSVLTHPLKLHAKRAKSSITQPWMIQFRSNFVQSLNTWHPKCCKSSRSRGQRSRSRRDITCAKIRKIINNSAGDCSISLKFRTDFNHVTLDVPRTFKVNGSKVKVTAWHNVSII